MVVRANPVVRAKSKAARPSKAGRPSKAAEATIWISILSHPGLCENSLWRGYQQADSYRHVFSYLKKCTGIGVEGALEIWRFGDLDIWIFGDLQISSFEDLGIWRFGDLEVW